MRYMFMPLRRYGDFEGRSRRQEFWLWQLLNLIVAAALLAGIVGSLISAISRVDARGGLSTETSGYTYTESYGGVSTSYSWEGNIDPYMLMEELGPVSWVLLGLYTLWGLFVFIPGLAVLIRRLHDTDRSGWWIFINLVPLVGPIVLFVFLVLDGTRGPNRFGPDPKQ